MGSRTFRAGDGHPRSARLRLLIWILLLLTAGEFVVRGPVRYLRERTNWNDLSQIYTASKLWLMGRNPSDPVNFVALWKQEGKSRLEVSDIRVHLAPPLGALVLMAPVAAFPWNVAKVTWIIILLISFAMTAWALVPGGQFRWSEPRSQIFVAACLALAPFHTGFASGNLTVLVIGMCALAIRAAQNRRDITAGILFGLACSLKPHIGAPLVLYYLLRRRWSMFLTALSSTLGLVSVAALRLQLRGVSWTRDYFHNAQGFVTA